MDLKKNKNKYINSFLMYICKNVYLVVSLQLTEGQANLDETLMFNIYIYTRITWLTKFKSQLNFI